MSDIVARQVVRVTVGPEIASYGFPDGHPFGPHRMQAFWDEAEVQGLDGQIEVARPVPATEEELLRFHTADYVRQVRQQSVTGTGYLDFGDTPAFPGVFEAASHVVGSALDAMRQIMAGNCGRAFVPIAGLHHARPERAGGFCVFNDIGVVIHALRHEYGIRRIAYVDIDAHHGDGVFYAFESDPEVRFLDFHQDGRYLYPGTGDASEVGKGEAVNTKLNIPMPPGAGDVHFMQRWSQGVRFLEEGRPEFVILQCGADSIAGDPLAQLRLSSNLHGQVTTRLVRLAEDFGHGRMLALGGGGYNPFNIGKGWCAVVRALIHTPYGHIC
ncbi:MAG: acetoin utilization protein AcuC [Magnetococcales bacterium]|nr:acetoin utilization protein AcuC [Magnetococcales bacterium]